MTKFNGRKALLVFSIAICSACGKSLPGLKNIDREAWLADKNGCSGTRASSMAVLQQQKSDFLGLSEMEIVEVFGKPDRNELYKRNQKFYYYYLQASPDCTTPTQNAQRLAIRFNAMGLAKEISIE
ncbi:hypothetical protein [Ohtaekwangia sp.]|uniref:hypothetical protein n=1 Tax=Ohtaekwangia sp. TaxID=2066019 RepID=UPI002F93E5BB